MTGAVVFLRRENLTKADSPMTESVNDAGSGIGVGAGVK